MSSRITSEERSIGVTSNLERPIFEQATIDGAVLSDTLRVNLSTGAVTTMSPKSARISAASCFRLHWMPSRRAQARRRQCLQQFCHIASQINGYAQKRT